MKIKYCVEENDSAVDVRPGTGPTGPTERTPRVDKYKQNPFTSTASRRTQH